jgi:hypothetical protein
MKSTLSLARGAMLLLATLAVAAVAVATGIAPPDVFTPHPAFALAVGPLMAFKVRDGFVCKLVAKIDLGDGKFDLQESTIYGGQKASLSADQADLHAQKLEPLDKAAAAYLEGKVMPQAPGAALGLTPEALALVQAMAGEMAKQIVSAMQAPAPAAAAAG